MLLNTETNLNCYKTIAVVLWRLRFPVSAESNFWMRWSALSRCLYEECCIRHDSVCLLISNSILSYFTNMIHFATQFRGYGIIAREVIMFSLEGPAYRLGPTDDQAGRLHCVSKANHSGLWVFIDLQRSHLYEKAAIASKQAENTSNTNKNSNKLIINSYVCRLLELSGDCRGWSFHQRDSEQESESR